MSFMIPDWDAAKKYLSFNKIGMMHEHYLAVSEQIRPRGQKERDEFAFFSNEYTKYNRRAVRLMNIRWVLYIILYATLMVNLLKVIPFLRFLVAFVELGSAIVGSGIAFILILFVTARINLHMQRMEACMYHLSAMYHQNPKRDTQRAIQRMKKVI